MPDWISDPHDGPQPTYTYIATEPVDSPVALELSSISVTAPGAIECTKNVTAMVEAERSSMKSFWSIQWATMTKKAEVAFAETTPIDTSNASTSKPTQSTNVPTAGARQVSSAGEKRIKSWFGAWGKHEYVLAGLAVGLGLIGHALERAMEGMGRTFDGAAIW